MENIRYKKLKDILTAKDYQDDNGFWVVVHDLEIWEKMGNKMPMNTTPYFVDKGMEDPDWRTMENVFYPAREHTVSTTEPFSCVTPLEEVKKIEKRQQQIYEQIVDETLDYLKTDFLNRLKTAPHAKMFLESELDDWRNYKFYSGVRKNEKRYHKIIPIWIDELHPTIKMERGNNQARERGRLMFLQWLEKYQLSNDVPAATSTGREIIEVKKVTTNQSKVIKELECHLKKEYHSITVVVGEVAKNTKNTPTTVWNTLKAVREGRLKAPKLTPLLPENNE